MIKVARLFCVCWLVLLFGCKEKIEITTEYIEFGNKPDFLNGFSFVRIENISDDIPPQKYSEVAGEKFAFITDSNFVFNRKIYFNKIQKGFKWVALEGGRKSDRIGELRKGSWYIFNHLHHLNYRLFVYFYEDGKSKIYVDQRVNW